MGYDLGVDLGTTFVAAAIARSGRVEMCTLGNQAVVTPAVAYLSEGSTLLFGEAAERRALIRPDRVERFFKRRLGDPTPVVLGGVPFQVTALMGAMLRDLVHTIASVEGSMPDHVALTHPANWGPYRRELFEEIPRLAGLSSHHSLTEPEAAATHYAASRHLDDGDTLAVYDLGGGTFDATVLRKHHEGIELLGKPEGIERLGGIDFDEAIIQWINYNHGGALSELDLTDPQTIGALAKLRQECVLAKEALSVDTETTISVLLPSQHFQVKLTRWEFEGMIRAPIESTIGTLIRAVRTAEVGIGQLAAVLLVGGSSRIPLVARVISEELGRPILVDAHPKYAVALGAAGVAARRAGSSYAPAAPVRAAVGVAPPAVAAPDHQRDVMGVAAVPVGASAPGVTRVGPPAAEGAAGLAALPGHVRPGTAAAPGHAVSTQAGRAAAPAARDGRPVPPGGGRDGRRPFTKSRRRAVAGLSTVAAVVLAGVAFTVIADQNNSATGLTGSSASHSPSVAASAAAREPAPTPATAVPAVAVAVPSITGTIRLPAKPDFVAVSPNGRQLYIADAAAHALTVVDTSTNKVSATIPVPTGPPRYLTFSPDGHFVYISVWDDPNGKIHKVSALDTTDDAITWTIDVLSRPFFTAVSPDGKLLYVPNHDTNMVSVVGTSARKVISQIVVPPNPHYVALSTDGRLAYTANHQSNVVSVIDTTTRKVVATVPVDRSPHSLAVNPRRPLLVNVNYDGDTVTVVNTTTNKVIKHIPVGREPLNINWAPDGRFAYVVNNGSYSVWVISADTLAVTAKLPMGRAPTSIAVLPDGSKGYVSNVEGRSLTVLSLTAR